MISGATGAVAVVIVSLAQSHGVEYIFATVGLAGMIQMLAGALKLGKFIRLVPHSVMFGFVNGLAIVIFLAQLASFKVAGENGEMGWMIGDQLNIMLSLVFPHNAYYLGPTETYQGGASLAYGDFSCQRYRSRSGYRYAQRWRYKFD